MSMDTGENTGTTNQMSLATLQKENEMLKRKIIHLNSIITLKDNTIDELNKKLLTQIQLATKESRQLTSRSNTPISEKPFEIPQRSSNRSSTKNHSKSNSVTSTHLSNSNSADSETKQTFPSHIQKDSITSITSSHYSESEPPATPQQELYPNESTRTLNLELDLKQGNMTLGSSPRKLSPNRKSVPIDDLLPDKKESEKDLTFTKDLTLSGNNTINDDHETYEKFNEFHFGAVESPVEPVYKKSLNSSPIIDYFNQKSIDNYANQSDSVLNLKSHSRTHSRSSSQNVSVPKVLTASKSLQNKKDTPTPPPEPEVVIVNVPSNTTEKPTLPSTLPPNLPHLLSSTSYSNDQHALRLQSPPPVPTIKPLSQPSHKRIASADDSEKFLLNSLNHSIIRIESLIHPQSLALPIDTNNANHPLAKTKRNTYKISFMVYTDENAAMLTPIYRVKKSYDDLILMDKKIRPLVPSLPQLPDFAHVASLNYKYWANSKKVIQSYINKLLLLLKNNDSLSQSDPIWKSFSNYFEFKMDQDNLDDPEYSVLNLQDKLTYLFYIKKNFTAKTYDFVRLQYSIDSNELTMHFILSKTKETLRKDEIGIYYRGQEITLKKKKKFQASKTWVLYAESEYDASEVCNGLNNWIDAATTSYDDDDRESVVTTIFKEEENESHSKLSLPESSVTTLSPMIPAPWKIFKKSGKNSQQSQLLTSPISSSTPTMHSNSIPGSPVRMTNNSPAQSNESILHFKAMPYESSLLTPDSSSQALRSPMRLSHTIGSTDLSFKPIDESSYFSSTLQHSYDLCPDYKLNGMGVPSIVYQCITFLHQQSGEGFEGIFRLNGMMSEVNKIQSIFNEKYDCQLSKLTPIPDVHSIATLLKRYLRNLKDSLIPLDTTSEIGRIINTFGVNKSCEVDGTNMSKSTILNAEGIFEFSRVFNEQIPELNKNTLHVLFKYLCDVLKMGQHNKMSTSAMSVLMGPNITQGDGGGQICIILLENFNDIFQKK
ncbi:hypothetical protein CANINC_001436 [Pichia inconspicua]|uniref:Rho-GAP domain-containing protein n=1 Tax=Pichia inconspicua TaxID=52247 RepID=A0A4T0X3W5_9ASCO|nr:hypothetical protein CANINC_001436 [[Candida] inconspicua]